MYVAPQAFRQQLDYLQQNGYHTVTFAELVGAFKGEVSLPDKPVILTFDDGWDDIYSAAYPMLKDHGMRATFFIPTNWVENLDGVVSWSQLKAMSAGGMELGSHSVTHPYLTTDAGSTATSDGLLTLLRLWVHHWTTIEDFAGLLTSS